MSTALNLIIARGFDSPIQGALNSYNNQRQAQESIESANINQQGALQNQQWQGEDRARADQLAQQSQAKQAALQDLYGRAEQLAALDPSDPQVQSQWRQIAIEKERITGVEGSAFQDIMRPKEQKTPTSVQEFQRAQSDPAYAEFLDRNRPQGGGAQSAPKPPQGYVWRDPSNPTAGVNPLPGGPADPSAGGSKAGRDRMALRKEFQSLQSVKDYETSLPLLVSARNAPDTPAGDLQVIYTVGKVLDPNSVVREGELQLTKDAAPWLQKAVGEARKQMSGQGTLTPETRASLLDALNQRVLGYRQAYDMDYEQYASYSQQAGFSPADVVGKHSANAYKSKGAKKAPDPLGIR